MGEQFHSNYDNSFAKMQREKRKDVDTTLSSEQGNAGALADSVEEGSAHKAAKIATDAGGSAQPLSELDVNINVARDARFHKRWCV